jgi:hypothetical protein
MGIKASVKRESAQRQTEVCGFIPVLLGIWTGEYFLYPSGTALIFGRIISFPIVSLNWRMDPSFPNQLARFRRASAVWLSGSRRWQSLVVPGL